MNADVLIVSQPGDVHAHAARLALARKGHSSYFWNTSDFPSRATESVTFSGPSRVLDAPTASGTVGTVWNRRPDYVIDQETLHPADLEFAELNCRLFRKSLFDLLHPTAFWVNPHESVRRLTKLLQFARAQEVGLRLPETIFTNDPEKIRSFLGRQPQGVVYKPLSTLPWRDEETYWMPYTAVVTEEDLPEDAILRAVPGIYQALVPKAHELRVTVMGQAVFTAKVLSQETQTGRLDWRKAYHELRMEEGVLPPAVAERCVELLRRLGFVFGCFDLIVTPEGEHVFLEVNQMGQFLFVESYADLPLLDAFTDFLVSREPSFRWSRTSPRVRYADVADEARAVVAETEGQHVRPPEAVWRE